MDSLAPTLASASLGWIGGLGLQLLHLIYQVVVEPGTELVGVVLKPMPKRFTNKAPRWTFWHIP